MLEGNGLFIKRVGELSYEKSSRSRRSQLGMDCDGASSVGDDYKAE